MKLFVQIEAGFPFYFYDKPDRILIKTGPRTALTPENIVTRVDPAVLVFPHFPKVGPWTPSPHTPRST